MAEQGNSDDLGELETRLGVRFKNRDLLARALSHRSLGVIDPTPHNEQLEFLGDAVVGLIVGEYLYTEQPESAVGKLAKLKSYIVDRKSMAQAAQQLGLHQFVRLGPGEEASNGRYRDALLEDTFEAVVGAIYLDSGYSAAKRVVLGTLQPSLHKKMKDEITNDPKSQLQEISQAQTRLTPAYRIISESGEDHNKTFEAEVLFGNEVVGRGSGKSKKEAEKAAAQNALVSLDSTDPQ